MFSVSIELGKFYANGEQFVPLKTSLLREDDKFGCNSILDYNEHDLIQVENATEDNISTAIIWLESAIKSEDSDNIGISASLLGKLYAAENNPQKDAVKALGYYKRAKEHIDFNIEKYIVDLFINNSASIDLGDILSLLNGEGFRRDWNEFL